MDEPATLIFLDGCAVNRLALMNVDPVRQLAGSDFTLAMTADLADEYRRALDHLYVPPYVKTLLRKLLEACERHEAADPMPGPTDRRLVALAARHLVVTDDAKLYRRYAETQPGLVAWPAVETRLRDGKALLAILRAHVASVERKRRAKA